MSQKTNSSTNCQERPQVLSRSRSWSLHTQALLFYLRENLVILKEEKNLSEMGLKNIPPDLGTLRTTFTNFKIRKKCLNLFIIEQVWINKIKLVENNV